MRIPRSFVIAGLLSGAAGTLLLQMGGRVMPRPPAQSEPEARIVIAQLGGTVDAVLVKAGDRVKSGQMLIRLRATEIDERIRKAEAALDRTPPEMVATAGSLVTRISPQLWHRITASDPELLAAEQSYVDAASAAERAPSAAASARVRHAAAKRLERQRRIAEIRPDSVDGLGKRYSEIAEDVKWLSRQRSAAEVRAPFDGIVEILDLHPGDVVAPFGRVALVACTACVPETR